ncbi:MAG: hypothetical protein KBS82_06415 [Oscillospiraceae bacterium]|nr:hypothetical protein [Candidatus Limimonas egerieequi]
MKKILSILLLVALLLTTFTACTSGKEEDAKGTGKTTDIENPYDMFHYTHYASGGTPEEETAVVLFEQSNATFTSYQIAFISCTCRDPSVNYYSVMYIELLNTKQNPEDASIRAITFSDGKGLWGDSNPTYGTTNYTPEYFNENFVQPMVGKTKADFDAWGGYKKQIEGIDVDAVTAASVSTSNITSCIKSLFEYHVNKYYKTNADA